MIGLWSWPWLLTAVLHVLRIDTLGAMGAPLAQLAALKVVSARLLVAAGCGAVVGLERKDADRPAGLRSMTLVSAGSALYTLACIYGITNGDANRAAAQVCTGVGFIGAGVIAKGSFRDPVRGVTTACAVWVSAALGVVAASGLWLFAIYSCGLTVTILRISRWYNAFTRSKIAEVGPRGHVAVWSRGAMREPRCPRAARPLPGEWILQRPGRHPTASRPSIATGPSFDQRRDRHRLISAASRRRCVL